MFAAVRTALATTLATVSGLNTDPNGLVQGAVTIPAAIVLPGDPFIDYSSVMDDDAFDLSFTVLLCVGMAYSPEAQLALDAYLEPSGANSVRAVLEGAQSAAWDYVTVRRARNVGQFDYAGQTYYGGQLDVEVKVS